MSQSGEVELSGTVGKIADAPAGFKSDVFWFLRGKRVTN